MKNVFPWILVILLGAANAFQFSKSLKKDLDLTTLRAQLQETENQGDANVGQKAHADSNELERLRKESEEVYKLRNQVAQLQKQLRERPAPAPAEAGEVAQAEDPTATSPEVPEEDPVTKQQREQCITNLKAIDEAKTMWAVANNKQAGEKMTVADITTALPNSTMPLCPAGGVYTLHEVGIPPTCSIEAHSLLP